MSMGSMPTRCIPPTPNQLARNRKEPRERARPDPHPGAAPDRRGLLRTCHRPHRAAAEPARRHRLRPAVIADADRHAGVDRARPHRADLHVHADRRAHGIGRAQAVHRAGKLRDHGDPVLHPGRHFPHPWRRRPAHDRFRHRDGRALVWRPGAWRGCSPARCLRRCPAPSPATVVAIGSVILPAMVAQGFPKRFGAGVITTSGSLGILDSAVDPDGALRGRDQFIGRQAVHRRHCPGHRARDDARRDDLVSRLAQQLSAHAEGHARRALAHFPRLDLGPAADRHRDRRHLYRPVHADRSRRDERGLCLHRRGLRLQGPQALRRAARAAVVRQSQRHAALHHHQRGAVLVPDDLREHSARSWRSG